MINLIELSTGIYKSIKILDLFLDPFLAESCMILAIYKHYNGSDVLDATGVLT